MKKVILNVSGMHCASCASVLDKGLSKMQGVKEANVNFSTSKAQLLFDEKKVSVNDFLRLVEKKGYSAVVGADFDEQAKRQKRVERNTIQIGEIQKLVDQHACFTQKIQPKG